jgi:hypothetical protein
MIKVYYSSLENEWLRFNEPEPVFKTFVNNNYFENTGVIHCPAFRDSLKNMFSLKSLYSYQFSIYEDRIESSSHDEKFFNDHVVIRSFQDRTFSFTQWISIFTEEDSLPITVNINPYLENNEISKRCMMPTGTYDMAKWFRNLEFVFKLRPEYDQFIINENDIYQYIKFHTDKKIKFIPYRHDGEISSFMEDIVRSRNYLSNRGNLEGYYKFYKTKKLIAKKIKERILI